MKRKAKDRHIDIPAEANRGKHINFVAIESGDPDPRSDNAAAALANSGENDNDRKDPQKNNCPDAKKE
jgi:hypothetical protein